MRNGRKLKLRCQGAGLTFPLLDAAAGGTFGVRLDQGEARACMVFGGDGLDRGTSFIRRDAAPPVGCPLGS